MISQNQNFTILKIQHCFSLEVFASKVYFHANSIYPQFAGTFQQERIEFPFTAEWALSLAWNLLQHCSHMNDWRLFRLNSNKDDK